MRRLALSLTGLALLLGGCVTSPKETVLNLDTTDHKWTSPRCVAARKEVARFDDQKRPRQVVSIVGNVLAPFVGTATSAAMGAGQSDDRKTLNHKVRAACISDPLKGKAVAARRGARVASR
jgi:hypothetical protein